MRLYRSFDEDHIHRLRDFASTSLPFGCGNSGAFFGETVSSHKLGFARKQILDSRALLFRAYGCIQNHRCTARSSVKVQGLHRTGVGDGIELSSLMHRV